MASISLVSTLLPAQHHATPLQSAVSAANPTAGIAPVATASSNGNSGSSTDGDSGAGGGSSGDPRAWFGSKGRALSGASAQSVVNAKTEAGKRSSIETEPPSVPEERASSAWSEMLDKANAPTDAQADADNGLRKAEGPLPIPTADILLKFKKSGPY